MIEYKAFYKYQLAKGYILVLPFAPMSDIRTKYIDFTRDGVLHVKRGYAWDGASGPLVDTQKNMRGSLVHDASYQLMRTNLLHQGLRDKADQLFRDIVIEDGVSKWRAYVWYYGLRWLGKPAASPHSRKETREAP
jgi:hypothetical protein